MSSITWDKIEDENGYSYYFNKSTGVKQWDHPKFSEIGQRLDDCNYVKYSIYRVALKFRVLQNALYMDDVPLSIIAGVFERHRLGANESTLCLESCELEAVLSDIYFASNKKNHTNVDVDFATELMLNFLYNVYDKNRKGKIQVLSTKMTLAILSNCDLKDMYRYIFQQCSDHNNCITRQRLQSFLSKIIEITTYLHEDASYGLRLINISVENCFLSSPGFVGINETIFISWVESNPKIISWLPILYRIRIAEPALHSLKCTTCKTNPVMGLLYKCTKCRRYIQCQRCFFTGRATKSHKLSHPMREYCTTIEGSYSKIKFFKKLFNVLQCTRRGQSVIVDTKPLSNDQDCLVTTSDKKEVSNIKPMSSPITQLKLIIKRLEMQNKELQQFLFGENLKEKEVIRYLEEHRIHINAQIEKLKTLKNCLNLNDNSPSLTLRKSTKKRIVESTPVVRNNFKPDRYESKSMEMLSPITSVPEPEFTVDDDMYQDAEDTSSNFVEDKSVAYCIDDMSTWIGGHPKNGTISSRANTKLSSKRTPGELHNDLDEALAKLQQILANNFSLDESLGHIDNTNLKYAMSEVEGMLTSFIDTVENSRASSVRSRKRSSDLGVAV